MSELILNTDDLLPENATDEGVIETINGFLHNKANFKLSETGEAILKMWEDEAVKRGLIFEPDDVTSL